MSFLTSRTPLFARSMVLSSKQVPIRSFAISMRRTAMSESDTHRHDHAERTSEIDKHKSDSVSKAKDGKGEWKKELSTNSEAAVKADREDIDASKDTINKMQKETEELMGNKK